MISASVPGEDQRMVPQPSSFTGAQQNGEFTAGGVVSIDSWCLLSSRAQPWSSHGSGLQIIGGPFLNRDLRRPRRAHDAGSGRILKPACCLGRSRAPSKNREARYGGAHANPDRCFRMFRIHAIYGGAWFVGNHRRGVRARIVAAFQTSANSIVIETYKTKVLSPPQSRRQIVTRISHPASGLLNRTRRIPGLRCAWVPRSLLSKRGFPAASVAVAERTRSSAGWPAAPVG